MAAAVTVTPVSPVEIKDACVVHVTGADPNDAGDYTTEQYPTRAELRYYLAFVKGGVEYGRSYVFAPGADGTHEFPNYIFPSDGAWDVNLCNVADDSVAATVAVTVQAQ